MQLDKTRIDVRERAILDILDLALHVTRAFLSPIALTLALGVLPFMLLNHWLLGWQANLEFGEEWGEEEIGSLVRYLFNMGFLIFLEAPLASVFTTAFLGRAVFHERPPLREVVSDVMKMAWPLILCQVVLRGVGLAIILLALVDRNSFWSVQELFVVLLVILVSVIRAVRPFTNEIVILERNPLRSPNKSQMTVGRRSSLLHGPGGGDLLVRWFTCALVTVLLSTSVFSAWVFVSGVFLGKWVPGPIMVQLFLPLSVWLVAGFMTVVRFLSYLDLRIRQEGWEVELRLRAEAARLVSKFV